MSSARLLSDSSAMLAKSLARLSSGTKITAPEDDAAGLAVSMRLEAQISRVGAAKNNVNNAVSFNQTQDGFMSKVSKALDRMSELSILAQDVTKSDSDRTLYDNEFQQLDDYIANVATKDFNGVSLFTASALNVTIDGEGNTFSMSAVNLGGASYTALNALSVTTSSNAASALTTVKAAITKLAQDRATGGASAVRLGFTSEQLGIQKENLAAANSRIKDTDVAEESTRFAKYNILVQAGTAMLAQANATPQSALRLLQ